MSFSEPLIQQNPRTTDGVAFSAVGAVLLPEFLLHESGMIRLGTDRWRYDRVLGLFWRLYYNLQSGCWIVHEGKRHPIGPDHLLVVPENIIFDCHGKEGVSHLWMHFSIHPSFAFQLGKPFSVPMTPEILAVIRRCLQCHQKRLDRRTLFHASHGLLHTCFSSHPLDAVSRASAKFSEIIHDIERTPGADHSNPVLARKAGISIELFSRRFRELTGVSPARFVRRARVRHASQLLAFGDRSLEEIADLCGFPNRHYLTRVFTAELGESPAAYRRNHRVQTAGNKV